MDLKNNQDSFVNLKFINETDKEVRLDIIILNSLASEPEYAHSTRSQIKNLILGEKVLVNGKIVTKAGFLVKPKIEFEIFIQKEKDTYLKPYDFPLNIVFEDKDLLVINKPANLSMHPGAGNKEFTLLNALVFYLQKPAYLVHRLDKDTTGLVIVAKNENIQNLLTKQFLDKKVNRLYYALALVGPRGGKVIQESDSGRIETFYGRHPIHRKKMSVLKDSGRIAITNWKVIEKFDYAYLLELKLGTGRTHQIRVHLDYLKSPIIGDTLYGNFQSLPEKLQKVAKAFNRQALHSYFLQFIHPRNHKLVSFQADFPEDFKGLLDVFKTTR